MLAVSRFLDPLRVEQVGWVDGRPEWRTLARLRYISSRLGGVVEIPADFDFDGASVPRLPLVWLVAGGRGTAAAALHDYGYQRGGVAVDGTFQALSRHEIDSLFSEALAADPMSGTNAVGRWIMWAGVRLGGRWPWRKHQAREAALNPEWAATTWPEGP